MLNARAPSSNGTGMPERRAILVLGQKKAGTTSLYAVIAATGLPLIDVPKESGILANPKMLEHVLRKVPPKAVLLDATTTYFDRGTFPLRLAEALAEFDRVTALFICRRERDRLPSHYRHACNFDGWSGPLEDFVQSGSYLHHARIGPAIAALHGLGVTDVHVLPFDILNAPESVTREIERIVGARPDLSEVEAENSFGAMLVVSRPMRWFLRTHFFQIVLKSLLPEGFRQRLKYIFGREARNVEIEGLEAAPIAGVIDRIDAENAALIERYGPDAATDTIPP